MKADHPTEADRRAALRDQIEEVVIAIKWQLCDVEMDADQYSLIMDLLDKLIALDPDDDEDVA
jgi:hypothetical protein